MRTFKRAVLFGAAAVAMGAASVMAQTVTFSTAGAFTGAGCAANVCTFGSYTLTYNGQPSTAYGAPTLVDVGNFSALCTTAPGVPCPLTSIPGGVTFTLTITQTTPSGGTGTFTGAVAGAFTFSPTTSTMKWTPTTSTIQIGTVTYSLVTDNTGNINIVAPATGFNPNLTNVKANIVATPEPSTVALMATGIFGLVPLIRRRRR
jgi:hypothetical protein